MSVTRDMSAVGNTSVRLIQASFEEACIKPDRTCVTCRGHITCYRHNGKERLLVVFDDGNMLERKGGHYLMLNCEHLTLDPTPKS